MALNFLEMMMSYLTLWVIRGSSCKKNDCSYEKTKVYTFTKGPDVLPNVEHALLVAKNGHCWANIYSVRKIASGVPMPIDDYEGNNYTFPYMCSSVEVGNYLLLKKSGSTS